MLAAWRDSPTRLREDAATEADLVSAGYRDRVLTELAQNAADAANKAGVPGRLTVRLDGRVLSIANTGAPLDLSGVHALTALRASGKADPGAVGRFGVGFTAVLSVSDDIEIRSTTGSLHFSRQRTLNALHDNNIHIPGAGPVSPPHTTVEPQQDPRLSPPGGATAVPGNAGFAVSADTAADDSPVRSGVERQADSPRGGFDPPVLRLVWPSSGAPCAGADTEVVLRLRDDADADELLAVMRAEAAELLVELPALRSIRIAGDEFGSAVRELGGGLQELRVDGAGESRVWWQYRTERARWLLPVRAGRPVPAGDDVLRAPTRSDEELSLPALLIADVPMQPDRRRLLPGARIAELVSGYGDFARALPPRDRLVLVPAPAFARSEADALLREAVTRELRTTAWLPVLSGTAPDDLADQLSASAAPDSALPDEGGLPQDRLASADRGSADIGSDSAPPDEAGWSGEQSVPTRASVFAGLTAELAELLADVAGPLVVPELSGPGQVEALAVLDVHRLGLARLAELSGGLEREPGWWRRLYEALEPCTADPLAAEELGALAVPLADGRLVTGPRTVLLDDQLTVPIPVHWARLVHPEAAHPLLARLGARSATTEDLLNDPGLQAELTDRPDDEDTLDAVLRLAATANPALLPPWLSILELPDTAGDSRPADELLLPDAPLYPLLVEDAPLGTLDPALVQAYGAEALRAIGVGWDFGIVTESDPTGPDHQLDDEERWWAGLAEDPPELAAVRDLDLIDEIAWPDALHQLVSEPRTRRLLADRDGYTAWWLRRHARIDGVPLGLLRHPADTEFAGLLDAFGFDGFARADLDALRAVFADSTAMTPELASALLEALADPSKMPTSESISHAHRALAAAVAADRLDLADLALPDRVRALSGAVVDPADALILDQPWFALALPPQRLVYGAAEHAKALAALLDLPLASEVVSATVLGAGRRDESLRAVLGDMLPWRDGDLVLHDDLRVQLGGAAQGTVEVPWWRTESATHVRVPQRQADSA
ncbi:sacsin N-terminal ATP-binding-like domain-containing protein [Nocardia sp. NPDC127579]|uniref:sacsin N-terminal ATP-binding-like domain-containing protein n=1 Tax=Nocardia sp. NPDC127579 TaxID=3345402 RepID=UPI003633FC4E